MKKILTTLMLLAAGAALAGPDLAACRYENGNAIEPKVCDSLRRSEAKRAGQAERDQAQLAALRDRDAAQRTDSDAAAEQRRATTASEVADRQAKEQQMHAAYQQARTEHEAAEAQREKTCGKDYQAIRVGMSMKRVEQCTGEFSLVRQVNRADGVVSVYADGSTVVHVMQGRVVAWTAR